MGNKNMANSNKLPSTYFNGAVLKYIYNGNKNNPIWLNKPVAVSYKHEVRPRIYGIYDVCINSPLSKKMEFYETGNTLKDHIESLNQENIVLLTKEQHDALLSMMNTEFRE